MVGITLDVHDRRLHVLGLVAEGVDDDAARHGAVGADAAGLGRARDLQLAHLGLGPGDVEAECDAAPSGRRIEEGTTTPGNLLYGASGAIRVRKPACQGPFEGSSLRATASAALT